MENKKRLIDADALKKRFDERQADDIELYGGVHITECFPADDANEIVDKMPTIDAVEVVHGWWIWDDEEECWICSNCEMAAFNNYRGNSAVSNYCPNCGAKMDRERSAEHEQKG